MTRRPVTRALTPEERDLWRRVARQAAPLDPKRWSRLEDPGEALPDRQTGGSTAADRAAPRLPIARPDRKEGPSAPADRSGDKRLRRGRVEIEARIDLHGLTARRARSDLLAFLSRTRESGFSTVLVITGKGAGARAIDMGRFEPWRPDSPPLAGVLRRSFVEWLREPEFSRLVRGFSEAHRRHGGSGAYYVLLRP